MAMQSGSNEESGDARMGMIQVNDLVYKLETDLSVAINRTHKTQYFQNQEYTNVQTSIAILNSGADYIDPRRSSLSFDFLIPQTVLTPAQQTNPDFQNAFISCYFGKNGSVLNLIESVTVSSRSGDELSRVNDYGQYMAMMLPEQFGAEWRDSIGQNMGYGSFVGGSNNSTLVLTKVPTEQRRRRFVVPLYCLSPFFNYGRLLPSMLTSGLRIEIKWKPLEVAVQQFWEGVPAEIPSDGLGADRGLPGEATTEFKTFLGPSIYSGTNFLNATLDPTAVTYRYFANTAPGLPYLVIRVGGVDINGALLRSLFSPGDTLVVPYDANEDVESEEKLANEMRVRTFRILEVVGGTLFVDLFTSDDGAFYLATGALGGEQVGAWRLRPRRPLPYQRDFGARMYGGRYSTPSLPLVGYVIAYPEIAMCCVQLSDAIQRTLNELSSVNGLEIVYPDWDRTTTPFASGGTQMVYTEVRKSASRALMVAARVTRSSADTWRYDSFASCAGAHWNSWQFQLGSLYFPQQRVENGNSIPALKHDAVEALSFAYTQDAFDRFHPKAAPSMVTMRGTGVDFNFLSTHPIETHAEHGPDRYLAPYSSFGKWGSYVNGANTIAITLERSTLFDLSGIPINNSRVLALRGELDFTEADKLADGVTVDPNFRATLYVFLKYVRLARVFLVNCEVEQ